MQCYQLINGELYIGLPVLDHRFFVDGIIPNGRNNPVEVLGRTVLCAEPKRITPRNGDKPFWVLEQPVYPGGYLVLVCNVMNIVNTERESRYFYDGGEIVSDCNRDGTRDVLLTIRRGILRVVQQGKTHYLRCFGDRGYLESDSERKYRNLLQRDAVKAAQAEKDRVEREAERVRLQAEWEAKAVRFKAARDAEEKHWTKKSEELPPVTVAIRRFRHHSGVSLYEGHYRATDTYIEVVVPGDNEKPARTISVDKPIRTQTGWQKITQKRLAALSRTRPAQIKLIGKRDFEERDTGERRNPATWYEPDSAELAAWIARAVAAVSSGKEPVAK